MKIKNILLSNKYGIYFLIQYINVSFSRFATILIRRKTLESGWRDRAGSMALHHGEGEPTLLPTAQGRGGAGHPDQTGFNLSPAESIRPAGRTD